MFYKNRKGEGCSNTASKGYDEYIAFQYHPNHLDIDENGKTSETYFYTDNRVHELNFEYKIENSSKVFYLKNVVGVVA